MWLLLRLYCPLGVSTIYIYIYLSGEYLLLLLAPLLPDLETTPGPLQLMALSLVPCDDQYSSVFVCTYSDYLYHEQPVYQVLVVL